MAEDWRVAVRFEQEAGARELAKRLQAPELEHDLETSFHDRVVVSRDGSTVFCYADTRRQAEAAQRVIETLAREHGWNVTIDFDRWHPVAERWEPPGPALPETPAELQEEHAELIRSELDESRKQGFPSFEVRVKCNSHRDAQRLAEDLRAQGIPTAQRWEFVVAGADDEDTADALALRIRKEAPSGTTVTAEGSMQEVTRDAPYATQFSPFAVFGGLGG